MQASSGNACKCAPRGQGRGVSEEREKDSLGGQKKIEEGPSPPPRWAQTQVWRLWGRTGTGVNLQQLQTQLPPTVGAQMRVRKKKNTFPLGQEAAAEVLKKSCFPKYVRSSEREHFH